MVYVSNTHSVDDGEVDGAAQVDEILLGPILNARLVRDGCFLFVILVLFASRSRLFIRAFAKNFGPDLLVALLVLKELGIRLKQICRNP